MSLQHPDPTHNPIAESRRIVARARELGFALAGVCEALPAARPQAFLDWLSAGKHGSMSWMTEYVEKRLDPRELLPGARSIVVVADQYAGRADPDDALPATHGTIARYACGPDYHVVMKQRLYTLCDELRERHPGHLTKAFVDVTPTLEREHAARAGLGWIGKHTLIIHPAIGSYILLGGFLTTLELTPPPEQRPVDDRCGTCTRCIDACPTDAITPYSVDGSRCISYLTIERRGSIEPALHSALAADDSAGWLFGCDICQEVCPHNSPRPTGVDTGAPNSAYEPHRAGIDLIELLDWSETDRHTRLAGSAMKRARLDMLKRNALILLGERLKRERDEITIEAIRRVLSSDDEPDDLKHIAARILRNTGH